MRLDFTKLNKEDFESMGKMLLSAEYPEMQTVDGSGGDEGADSFIGEFNGEITIWQLKYFIRRLKNSQKTQITESLKTALNNHDLKKWILCVPLELSPAELKWFQKLKEEHEDVEIDILTSVKLKILLQKHKEVRDEYFKDEEMTLLKKAVNEIEETGRIRKWEENNAFAEQISAFKFKIINVDIEQLVKYLSEGAPYRQGLGFKKFQKDKNKYKAYFNIPKGKSVLRINPEDDNPFKLDVPYSSPIEVWIKSGGNPKIPESIVTVFTGNFGDKHSIIKIVKGCLPENTIIKEIDFNKTIKSMVKSRSKFSLTITTVKLDPNLIEKVHSEVGNEDINVEIRSNIIHSKKGGLPETKFMSRALEMVKGIRSDDKISDILFFMAKQTPKAIQGKIVTIEVHNDGRVRFWIKKESFDNKNEMKKKVDEFIDNYV